MNDPTFVRMMPVYDVTIRKVFPTGEFQTTYEDMFFHCKDNEYRLYSIDGTRQIIINKDDFTIIEKRLRCRRQVTMRHVFP